MARLLQYLPSHLWPPYPAIVISGLIFTDHDNAELQTVGRLVTGLGCGY